jgi:hypothetical protein
MGPALEEPIFALSRWAAGSPAHDVTLPLSNTAFMLSLRTMMSHEADPASRPISASASAASRSARGSWRACSRSSGANPTART